MKTQTRRLIRIYTFCINPLYTGLLLYVGGVHLLLGGCLGGAKVLSKLSESDSEGFLPTLSVPGRPTNLDICKARAYCACGRCGRGVVWTFFLSSIFPLFFLPLWETARYRLKYYPKGPLNPKQPNNHLSF